MTEPDLRPVRSADEAAEQIRAAQRDGASLLPCGRRSRLARHGPELRADRWLELGGMDRLLELDPEDQTCVVEPGLAPSALDRAVAAHGLELGVTAPGDGSLGGLFLAPDLSLLSGFFGPPRDQVLGADWLLADGSAVRTGARVVKSVAGYDLTRLFLGSRGRLAVCTRLVLRLRPRPRRPLWCHGEVAERAALPAPRLLFQVDADGPAYALLEGVEQSGSDAWASMEPGDGEAALRAALDGFARCSGRLLFPAGAPTPAGMTGPVDLLGGQAAADLPDPSEGRGAPTDDPLPAGARWIPDRRPSPWLAAIQRACAPGARPFGGELA